MPTRFHMIRSIICLQCQGSVCEVPYIREGIRKGMVIARVWNMPRTLRGNIQKPLGAHSLKLGMTYPERKLAMEPFSIRLTRKQKQEKNTARNKNKSTVTFSHTQQHKTRQRNKTQQAKHTQPHKDITKQPKHKTRNETSSR